MNTRIHMTSINTNADFPVIGSTNTIAGLYVRVVIVIVDVFICNAQQDEIMHDMNRIL